MQAQAQVLTFANAPGDRITTSAVRFSGGIFRMALDWIPLADDEAGAWSLTMATTAGAPITSGVLLRGRFDALYGVASAGRPPGAIVPYNSARDGDPGRYGFERDGWRLLYLPSGYDPTAFARYL
jgi:hypothetical protein